MIFGVYSAIGNVVLILAWLLIGCVVQAQDGSQIPSTADGIFSNDPCGRPELESQLWQSVEGKVSEVVDGRTILVVVPDTPHPVRVRIAAIALEPHRAFAERAREHLRKTLLNKSVDVLVNPSKWMKLPRQITAVIHLAKDEPLDLSLDLLAAGFVRFETPPPFTVSHYTLCQYRRAETEALNSRTGIWQN